MKFQTIVVALALTASAIAAPSQLSKPAKRGGVGDMLGSLLGMGGTKPPPVPQPQPQPNPYPQQAPQPAPNYGNDYSSRIEELQKAIDALEAAEATYVSTFHAKLTALEKRDYELTEQDKLLAQTDIALKETDKALKATDEELKAKDAELDRRLCALEKWLGERYGYHY